MKSVKFAIALTLLVTAGSGSAASAADAILLDFSSQHCGHCVAMQPVLAQLESTGVPVRHVDVAREPDLARRFGISKTPTFVVVTDGKEVTRLVGTHTASELRAALATSPSGPLIPTGAKTQPLSNIPAPQTRLAPIGSTDPSQTFTSAAAAAPAPLSEAMPSLSMADAVQRAEAATVRLRVHDGNGHGVGTGTIIDVHGEEALVLTCGHLFRDTNGKGKVEVDLFVGGQTRTVDGQVIDFDAEARDIALVAIRPGFQIQPVQIVADNGRVQSGQSAFSFGCDRGADPSRRDTRVTGINKYNQHLGVSNLEIAGAPIDGRSGGGLFDSSGRLIGVCNSADYQGDVGIYAGPGNIRWQLDRVNLAHLYQKPVSAAPPADRIASLPATQPGSSAAQPGLPVGQPAAVVPVSAVANPSAPIGASQALGANQEVIVIVRDRDRPQAQSQVMTLQNPTADLMQLIQSQAR